MSDPYVISYVSEDHEVIAAFEPDAYLVGAIVDGSGSVEGTGTYEYGSTATPTATPAAGWHFVNWTEGAVEVSTDASYSFTVTGSRTLTAHFDTDPVITAGAGAGGSIDPDGATIVPYGGSQPYSITPAPGYHITDVVVDTVSQGPVSSYRFNGVTDDHVITAAFALNTYEVNASVFYTGHGTVDPASQSVAYGGSASVDLVPDPGYHVAYLYDNGLFQEVADPYVIDDVSGAHNVLVVYDIDTYLVGVTADGSGSVGGGGIYEYGDPVTVSAAPDPGWYFVNWTEGGVEVSTDESYSFAAVSDRDLIAHFAPVPTDTWYLAEGCTMDGTETWVLVENPNPTPVTLDVTFVTAEGVVRPPELQGYALPPETRVSFDAGAYTQSYDLSTIVKATGGDIVAERSMYGADRSWATESIGAPDTDTYWYLAEGATGEGFETWVLVLNPGDAAVEVDLDFMTSAGPQAGPQDVEVPALSRKSFRLNDYLTDYDVSTGSPPRGAWWSSGPCTERTGPGPTLPIGAEPTSSPRSGSCAEGSTGEGFETWVLVQNPREVDTTI